MTDMDKLIARITGLQRADVERWIVLELVLPERTAAGFEFREVDVARIRLIRDLCGDMDVNEASLPLVLSLLDQLYDLRRRFHELGRALAEHAPEELRLALARQLAQSRTE